MFKTLSVSWFLCIVCLTFTFHSHAQESLDTQTGKKILVVGDSLSAAYKLSKEQGWVNLLRKKLRQQAGIGKSVGVINASISGATTDVGLQLLPDALERHRPDVVILELGANDGLQGKPVPFIKRKLSQLIELSLGADAEVLLLGVQLPPNFGKRYTEPFFRQYAELAKQYNLVYVPFFLEGVAGEPDLMMRDGLHPNAKAQPLVLENVWPSVERMLKASAS